MTPVTHCLILFKKNCTKLRILKGYHTLLFHTRPVPLRRTNRAQEGTCYLCGAHYTDPNVLHHRGALMRDNTATDGAASG